MPVDTGKGPENWGLKVNPYEAGSAFDWVMWNTRGRLYCCQRMKLGEECVRLWMLLTLVPTNPVHVIFSLFSFMSIHLYIPSKLVILLLPKAGRLFFYRSVSWSYGSCGQNLRGKASGICFTSSLSCGGNISGLDPAVQLVSRQEREFPRTFIADGPLFLAWVVPWSIC